MVCGRKYNNNIIFWMEILGDKGEVIWFGGDLMELIRYGGGIH
jgi:hypothetical protein